MRAALDALAGTTPATTPLRSSLLAVLAALAQGVADYVRTAGTAATTSSILTLASHLHDESFVLVDDAPTLQEHVCILCERVWKLGEAVGPRRDSLVAATLLYLLFRSLVSPHPAGYLKRLYQMRDALQVLDYTDPATHFMTKCMLKATMHPSFLRQADGRKLLAYMFTLHDDLVHEFVTVVRNQLAGSSGSNSLHLAYGEVLYRAWRDALGGIKLQLETALCSLAEASVHVTSTPTRLAVRKALSFFSQQRCRAHSHASADAIDSLLVRMYLPWLASSLSVANPHVRQHACAALGDMFPFVDPQRPEEHNATMRRLLKSLAHCLADQVVSVRVEACRTTAMLLGSYWELVPRLIREGMVRAVCRDLCGDVASTAVRVAGLEALRVLCENPHAAATLCTFLPEVGKLIWDASPRVRGKLVQLLALVQATPSLGVKVDQITPWSDVLLGSPRGKGNQAHPATSELVTSYYYQDDVRGQERVVELLVEECSRELPVKEDMSLALALVRHVVAIKQGAPESLLALISALTLRLLDSNTPRVIEGLLCLLVEVAAATTVATAFSPMNTRTNGVTTSTSTSSVLAKVPPVVWSSIQARCLGTDLARTYWYQLGAVTGASAPSLYATVMSDVKKHAQKLGDVLVDDDTFALGMAALEASGADATRRKRVVDAAVAQLKGGALAGGWTLWVGLSGGVLDEYLKSSYSGGNELFDDMMTMVQSSCAAMEVEECDIAEEVDGDQSDPTELVGPCSAPTLEVWRVRLVEAAILVDVALRRHLQDAVVSTSINTTAHQDLVKAVAAVSPLSQQLDRLTALEGGVRGKRARTCIPTVAEMARCLAAVVADAEEALRVEGVKGGLEMLRMVQMIA